MMIVILLILICILSYISVGVYRYYAIRNKIFDHPNQRSSHVRPVPIGGGIVFPILWLFFLLMLHFFGFEVTYLFKFLPPILSIGVISFFDDKVHLPVRYRFLVQLAAVIYSLVILGGFYNIDVGITVVHLGWLGGLLMTLALLWSINLYNFMDGIDGIAALEAIFIFGVGGYFVWSAGGGGLALAIWSVAAIMVGFFCWNRPPAKIFMGDVGSTFLGFLLVVFAILGSKKYNVPILLWVILYGAFWFDATITLLRRFINGEKWYQAHKLHAFQRLQAHDWSHSKIILGVFIINSILAALAVIAFCCSKYILFFLGGAIIGLTLVYLMIEKIQPMYKK